MARYLEFFLCKFPDEAAFAPVRPLLEVVVAAPPPSPPPTAGVLFQTVCGALSHDRADYNRRSKR